MRRGILLAVSLAVTLSAQDLKTTIEEVLSTNPIIQERLKNYNATRQDVTIAEAGYYPKLDLSLGVGNEDGETAQGQEFDFSVYQNSLTLTQNVFKGFETMSQVKQQKARVASAAYSYIEKVNDTSFEMLNQYLQVMKNSELLGNAQANVDINKEILNKVKKLYDAGLTTLSEVNKIESSLALAQSNYVVQENTLLDVTYNMQRVLGRYLEVNEMSRPTLNVALPATMEEAAEFAMRNNPSLLVSKYNIKLAQASYQEKKSPFYPSIDLELSQQKNKNLSGIEGRYDNLRAMAYLRYNFFNGFADKAALQKSMSTIHQEVQTKNQLRREVIEGLNLSWAANEKLKDQLVHLKEYKDYSLKTLTLYAKEYDLGRRSLLDLLSAQNDFIGAKAQIINTEYSMLFAKYRILDAMGILVTTVLNQEEDIVYSRVGLGGKAPKAEDVLPVSYDDDKDLIPDDRDICANSLSEDMKSIYGCKFTFDDTSVIERYTGFTFDSDSKTLTQEGQDRLSKLIMQIEPYGFTNMKFDIFGNVDIGDGEMKKDEIEKLSQERALAVKEQLIQAGALEENIVVHANSDFAPMMSNESSDAVAANNRADIIVRKLKK
jgi:adhesin transport system outer membrane protein